MALTPSTYSDPEIVQHLACEPDALVLAHARLHGAIQLIVGRVHHHGRMIQQRDLVFGLDDARVGHELLAVHNGDAFALQGEQNRRLDHVDSDRLFVQTAHFQLDLNLFGHVFGAPHLRRHRPAQQRNSGSRALPQPRAVELVMLRRRAEIPQDRLVILRQQREAADLVLRPCADVRGGDVAHIVHIEAQQRADLGFRQQRFNARQAFAAQTVEVDALLPIHRHRAVGFQCHNKTSCFKSTLNLYHRLC